MAVNVVQPKPEQRGSKGSSGGSKFGAIAGALGAAAIVGSGGAAAPAVLGAAGTGAALGGMGGGMINPATADTRQAIQRRVATVGQETAQEVNPQQTMQEAIMALREINDPRLTKKHAPILAQALIKTSVG